MSGDRYDHGLREYPCQICAGKGQVVTPHAEVRADGTIDTWESAETCYGCNGEGSVWN